MRGLLVVPGLIDLHTHVYWGGTSLGVDAVWLEVGFPTVTPYARKLMVRFSATRSSTTSEHTPPSFFFGKVFR